MFGAKVLCKLVTKFNETKRNGKMAANANQEGHTKIK
jgi:hypothetical protein